MFVQPLVYAYIFHAYLFYIVYSSKITIRRSPAEIHINGSR